MLSSKFGVVFRGLEKIPGSNTSLLTIRKLVDKPNAALKFNSPNAEDDCEDINKRIGDSDGKLEKRKNRKLKICSNCRILEHSCKSKSQNKRNKNGLNLSKQKNECSQGKNENQKLKEPNRLKDGTPNDECFKITYPSRTKDQSRKDEFLKTRELSISKEFPFDDDICRPLASLYIPLEENRDQLEEDLVNARDVEKDEPTKLKSGGNSGRKYESSNTKQRKDSSKTSNVCEKSPKKKGKDLKMKALLYTAFDQDVCLKEVEIPSSIKKDEVLIKVKHAGINPTDFAILEGMIPTSKARFIPGREFSGTICACGENVEHVQAGDTVAVAPCVPDSICRFCAAEKCSYCLKEGGSDKSIGLDRDGGWAEYSVVPSNIVYKVPEGTNELSAPLLPILAQVMCNMSKIKLNPCMEILILGGGLPGSLIALFLQHNGYENVVICEDNPNKVKQFEALCTGFPIVTPSKLCNMELDMVLSVGAGTSAIQKAINSLKVLGQFIIFGPIGGYHQSPEVKVPITDLAKKQIKIFGMTGTPSNPANIPPAVISSTLAPEKLGVEVYPLRCYREALTRVQTGDTSYALLQLKET